MTEFYRSYFPHFAIEANIPSVTESPRHISGSRRSELVTAESLNAHSKGRNRRNVCRRSNSMSAISFLHYKNMKLISESTAERKAVSALRLKQSLLRLFKANNFNMPKFIPRGVTYILCLQGSVPPRTSTFPLMFHISQSLLVAKIYFSLDNAPFITQNRNVVYRLQRFVEEANRKGQGRGRLAVEEQRGLLFWEDVLRVKNGCEIEERLVEFVNQTVQVFAFYIPTLYALTTASTDEEAICPKMPLTPEKIPFLRSQKDLFSCDSDTVAQIGLCFDSSPLQEVNYEEELKLHQQLRNSAVSRYVAWDTLQMEEITASAKFIQPCNYLSFAFFLTHSDIAISTVLTEVSAVVEALSIDSIYIDDLYERIYIEEGQNVRISPAVLTGHMKQEKGSYASLWGKIREVSQKVATKQQSQLTHSELWTKLDCFWKIDASSLYPNGSESDGRLVGRLGSIPVCLTKVNLSDSAQVSIESLAQELYSSGKTRCYGVTALTDPNTEELICYLVNDCTR